MMTQEEFRDVVRMHAEGMSFTEFAEATGYHRTTIAQWVKVSLLDGLAVETALDGTRIKAGLDHTSIIEVSHQSQETE